MTTEPIKIEFAINSEELDKEFQRIVSGAKSPDEAMQKLQERFSEFTAEQLLGVEGLESLINALQETDKAARKLDFDGKIISKKDVELQKSIVKELEAELKAFKKITDEMAPGKAQNERRKQSNAMANELATEKHTLEQMLVALKDAEEGHKSLASQVRSLLEEMRQLELQGKKNSAEYNKLKDEAAYLEEIRKRTRASLRGENDDMRALTASVNLLAGAYSTTMGVVGMFTSDTAKMERIQTKLQSAIALTVGVQQVSEGLAKESIVIGKIQALQTRALAKAKELEAAGTGKATIAQRLYNAVAKANPILLLVSAVLSLGAAYAVMRLAIGGATEEQRKLNKEIGKEAASSVSQQLVKYKTLQKQWKDLNGDLKKQNKFLKENKDQFRELGVQVDNVNDAENVLVTSSDAFLEAMLLRAKAAATATHAQKKYEEALQETEEYNTKRADLKGENGAVRKYMTAVEAGWSNIWNKLTGAPSEAYQVLQKELSADKFIAESIKLQEEAADLLKKHGIKTTDDLANNRLKTEKKTAEQIISERKKLWQDYYAFEATFGRDAAKKQYASLRKEASSFFDWLEAERDKYQESALSGSLSNEDLEAYLQVTKALEELKGEKSGLDLFTEQIQDAIDKTPILAEQLEVLDKAIQGLSKADIDSGKLSFLIDKRDDVARDLKQLTTDFINSNKSLEEQKTNITEHYAQIRAEIETRDIGDKEKERLFAELEKIQAEEIKKLEEKEKQKESIIVDALANVTILTRRELQARLKALEDYYEKSEKHLTDEEKAWIKSEEKRMESLLKMSEISAIEKQLLDEKALLLEKIHDNAAKGITSKEDLERLQDINAELKDIMIARVQKVGDIAGEAANLFSTIGDAVRETNEELADMMDTIADVLTGIEGLAQAAAGIASGDIGSAISGVAKVVKSVGSIVNRRKRKRRKRRQEVADWEEEAYYAGLEYNQVLRERLMIQAEINQARRSELDIIQAQIEAAEQQLNSVRIDMLDVWMELLGATTRVKHSSGKKMVDSTVLEAFEPFIREMGLHWGRVDESGLIIGSEEWFAQNLDWLWELLEEINATNPLTGDAATLFEKMKELVEEAGGIENLQQELEALFKDTLTGTTASALADGIIQGIASGKRSIADFGDDIEEILRGAILAGLQDTIFKEAIQDLQDYIARAMGDGELTADEVDDIKRMWEAIVNRSAEMMEQLDQTGLDLFSGDDSNSLRGAYKAASQESIDLLSGNTAALRLSVMDGNTIARNGFAQLLDALSNTLAVQQDIELNTRATAGNTAKLHSIDTTLSNLVTATQSNSRALSGNGF